MHLLISRLHELVHHSPAGDSLTPPPTSGCLQKLCGHGARWPFALHSIPNQKISIDYISINRFLDLAWQQLFTTMHIQCVVMTSSGAARRSVDSAPNTWAAETCCTALRHGVYWLIRLHAREPSLKKDRKALCCSIILLQQPMFLHEKLKLRLAQHSRCVGFVKGLENCS